MQPIFIERSNRAVESNRLRVVVESLGGAAGLAILGLLHGRRGVLHERDHVLGVGWRVVGVDELAPHVEFEGGELLDALHLTQGWFLRAVHRPEAPLPRVENLGDLHEVWLGLVTVMTLRIVEHDHGCLLVINVAAKV